MHQTHTILVTGANGFIGNRLVQKLATIHTYQVHASVYKQSTRLPENVKIFTNLNLSENPNWSSALSHVDCVIHCAARAHILKEKSQNPLEEFQKTNVTATLQLARQAVASGVKRFIFLSSIGVNGSKTLQNPFTAEDDVAPHSIYAHSKHEAELGLKEISKNTGLEVVIIRPPLVYGYNAPGNFGKLMQWLQKGIPLPLGGIYNLKSFVYLENLVDLIVTCIHHPKAANQTFLVSDSEDISTTDLLKFVSKTVNKSSNLIPVPQFLLVLFLKILGKQKMAEQLFGSLQVDMSKTKNLLNWKPPFSLEQAFEQMKAKVTLP